jgi:hypothetical protein
MSKLLISTLVAMIFVAVYAADNKDDYVSSVRKSLGVYSASDLM